MNYLLRQLKRVLDENRSNSYWKDIAGDYLIIIHDSHQEMTMHIQADVVGVMWIRFSVPLTGSLEDVSDAAYRKVRTELDIIATEAGVMMPYDEDEGRFAVAVKFSGAVCLLDLIGLTNLYEEVCSAINELRQFNANYKKRVDILLTSNGCPTV